ncbi:hypothetical protein F5Y18DRAFT_442140 [Xylariaceae sp. FL1019]|nr:hypothetical protein F5Y18DRAFT_442140 [Xylariaceae sp. FL1019]
MTADLKQTDARSRARSPAASALVHPTAFSVASTTSRGPSRPLQATTRAPTSLRSILKTSSQPPGPVPQHTPTVKVPAAPPRKSSYAAPSKIRPTIASEKSSSVKFSVPSLPARIHNAVVKPSGDQTSQPTAVTTNTKLVPHAAPRLATLYTDPHDIEHAQRQSRYHTLTPHERIAQDQWASIKAAELAPCPMGYDWHRHEDEGYPGYECDAHAHFISDKIIAEGLPAMYGLPGIFKHSGVNIADRVPDPHERVPEQYRGPVKPLGIDKDGQFSYWIYEVDEQKMREVDPALKAALGWK